MKKLKNSELFELKGGATHNVAEINSKKNTNNTRWCTCLYDNLNAIENINNVSGCICDCVGLPNNNLS